MSSQLKHDPILPGNLEDSGAQVVGTRRVDGRVPNCLLWAWGVGNDVNVP